MTQKSTRNGGTNPCRHRGAQPGNQNAHRHGRRSKAAIIARKLSVARVKALAHVIHAYDLAGDPTRYRIASLRPDQVELLSRHDPQLLALVPVGYPGPTETQVTDRERG